MATSPTLSLRDLMAEAKEEERKKVLQGVGGATAGPPSRPSSEDRSVHVWQWGAASLCVCVSMCVCVCVYV